jgi:hypothetical protein
VDEGWITVDDKMAAWTASAEFGIGSWTLIGDYLDVRDGSAAVQFPRWLSYSVCDSYDFQKIHIIGRRQPGG